MHSTWRPGLSAVAGWPFSPLYMKYSPMAAPAMGAMYCSGAESDAEAFTMIVYSIAPCFSSVSTRPATVEAFWPMAT